MKQLVRLVTVAGVGALTATGAQAQVRADLAKWTQWVTDAGIQPQ
jgi:hypothetical protein